MPNGIRWASTLVGIVRSAGLCVLLAALALVASTGALRAQEPPETKYLVQVSLRTPEEAKALAEAGFDVAGANPDGKTAESSPPTTS